MCFLNMCKNTKKSIFIERYIIIMLNTSSFVFHGAQNIQLCFGHQFEIYIYITCYTVSQWI